MQPATRITDPAFQYVPAAKTDIRARFAQLGFQAPSTCRPMNEPAEVRLRNLRAELDRLGTASRDGKTITFDADQLEAALARADGFGGEAL